MYLRKFFSLFREEAKARDRRIMMEVLGNENVPPGDTESDEEDQPMATNFRAKPVPEHTNQPVFQNMVREQPKRFVSDCEIPLKSNNLPHSYILTKSP